ncbi:glycoside hydrolase superfamily [Sphaerosporella brunnea]|uniref:Beta-mannosidase B n=1 Tax=Sphaerosporella brunnea TaxID=1250544 RepID=A0A5J5F1H4_9PEZI|nr:glycoside hydrolase superfamily [Sphaerosporella brunnea]
MSKITTSLCKGWSFRRAGESIDHLRPARAVPTEVFLDLLEHKLIPDPFVKKNELDVQWVGEEDWVYSLNFASPEAKGKTSEIVFEGLDTYATVTLNGTEILKSSNMFTPYRVDVTELLKKGGENNLTILFESAFLKGKKVKEQWPNFHWGCWNGDPSRLAVRKAQYHYGWDWGPTLLTCGPWKPIYLETFTSRIDELYFKVEVAVSLKKATVFATADIVGWAKEVVFTLTSPDGKKIKSAKADVEDGKAHAKIIVDDPELWYPQGYGKQPLYKLSAVLDGDADEASKRLGLRRARVVQRPLEDAPGLTFFFEVNDLPIWVAGSNWIPADNFLTRLDEQKYRRWLELVKEGRQVMVRVWGGGIPEHDCFYDICDELGLMVWQDFGFGCGNYPAMIPEFRESVALEATAIVKRLRHHPSIVIYAGNNEDYSYMWSIEGHLGYNPNDKDPENWLKTLFPARYIYEKILPETVRTHSPNTEYHPGSPYGTPERPDGGVMIVGDAHQWNVWHGTQEPYQNFDKLAGRFVSEFGMEAFPDIRTIDSYLPKDNTERHPFSETVEFHNKADGAERRIALYLAENMTFEHEPFEAYIYSTQLMQSEALSTAYRAWRRNWKGTGKEFTSGAIVWQINDCWPVTSWAIVDYYYRPKIAYYSIKRELAPIVIGSKRAEVKTPRDKYTNVHIDIEHRLAVWISSFLLEEKQGPYKLVAKAFDVGSGNLLESTILKEDFSIPANSSTELVDATLPGWNGKRDGNLDVVVALYLLDKDGRHVARHVSWPDPLKYVKVSRRPGIGALVWRGNVKVRAEKPVKGLVLVNPHAEKWEDQGVDLVPGEIVEIGGKGLTKGRVECRFYGGGETGVDLECVEAENFE